MRVDGYPLGDYKTVQSTIYTEPQRLNCLIYENIITTRDQSSLCLGKRHDKAQCTQIRLGMMQEHIMIVDGEHYYIYGNPAYLQRGWLY